MTNEEFDDVDPGEFPHMDLEHFPTYEELAFGGEWREEEPFVEPEPPRPNRLGYIGLTLIFLVVIATCVILLSHQQYDAGYVNGERDVAVSSYAAGEQMGMGIGYQDGEGQGKLEAMVGLQQWQYDHHCAMSKDGFVSLRMARGIDNQYSFECAVKK